MSKQDNVQNDESAEEIEEAEQPELTEEQPQGTASDDRVAALEAQVRRVMADFDNYRRRTEEERKQLIPLAQARTLLELTPVLDNFRRATQHLPAELQGNNWVTGVLHVEKQLEQIFEQFGVQKIKTIGEAFNPQFHEAIETAASDEFADNIIMAEVEGGYLLNGVVLKPAKVKVSSGSSKGV